MRSELLKVQKPVWARIVNPEPFSILEQTYRYGDVLLLKPEGHIRFLGKERHRVLAAYHAPHAPHDALDCPSDVLLFGPETDLRMMAEGKLGYEQPFDDELVTGMAPAPTPPCDVRVGQRARVPVARLARAFPPPVVLREPQGGFYRTEIAEVHVQPRARRVRLCADATLTAMEHHGPHLKARYQPVGAAEDECPEGGWFWMSTAEFIRMELRYQELRQLECLELQDIRRIMRSLSL